MLFSFSFDSMKMALGRHTSIQKRFWIFGRELVFH